MAATTSPDWLDSLSEEWVSEPRDPNSSPISNKTSESLQLHETTEEDDEVLETDLGYHEDVSPSDLDEIPSTMYVPCLLPKRKRKQKKKKKQTKKKKNEKERKEKEWNTKE